MRLSSFGIILLCSYEIQRIPTSEVVECVCFPSSSNGKPSAYNTEDPGSIPGLGRSPGAGNGNPLQYSCLENPVEGEDW